MPCLLPRKDALSHTARLIRGEPPRHATAPWSSRERVHWVRREIVEKAVWSATWHQIGTVQIEVIMAIHHPGDTLPGPWELERCAAEPCQCLCPTWSGGCGQLLPVVLTEWGEHRECRARRGRKSRARRGETQ